MKLKNKVLALCLCFFFILFSLATSCLAVGEDQARSAIDQADQTIKDCYFAVTSAEKAGGNVTDLLSILQDSVLLLSKANLALGKGNFDSAYDLAVQSKSKLDGFVSDASFLKNVAERRSFTDFMINIVGSSAGTVAIVVGSFTLWFVLKQKYNKIGT